jgi:CDGSH-type Zn-finger protein
MAEEPNVLRVRPDGPNVVTGSVVVETRTGRRELQTVVLCRCGRSEDKPFCDGAHVKARFADPARLPPGLPGVGIGSGRLTITPLPNGPNRCEGPLTIFGADGCEAQSLSTRLCRCGGSRAKPYCDGSHQTNGFRG